MTDVYRLCNRVKVRRLDRGWSQAELAQRAGISRTAVTAIEASRLAPSVATALALARALDSTVEGLFGLIGEPHHAPSWAWEPAQIPSRFWEAEVRGRTLRFPVESAGCGVLPHDGVFRPGMTAEVREAARETLVMACCDPAANLLATCYAAATGFRLLIFSRSSQQALELLRRRLVHVAGLHLATAEQPQRNQETVQARLGDGYRLVRVARWQEGVVLPPGGAIRSVDAALRSKFPWIGREPGSGARQCLDELLAGRRAAPRRLARDHRGVAEAVKCGWAGAGVCLRLVSEEAGLTFLSVREEAYDLCFPEDAERNPRIQALLQVLRSASYRKLLGELPGYDTADTGEAQ